MLVTCSAHTANNGTGSPPHLVPLSVLYLTLATSLLRFVPTVGVVSVLCMRAVTCKNGRRRSYFGSWLHLDSLHPPLPIFSLAPFIHTLLLLSLWWLQGSGWHCGQCMLHIISFITREKKRKKNILRRFESNRQQSFFPCFSSLFLLYSCFTLSCRGYMHFLLVFAPGTGAQVCKDTNILYILDQHTKKDFKCFL